jgi:hypothetical protein
VRLNGGSRPIIIRQAAVFLISRRALLLRRIIGREERAFLMTRDAGWWSRRFTRMAREHRVSLPTPTPELSFNTSDRRRTGCLRAVQGASDAAHGRHIQLAHLGVWFVRCVAGPS